MKKRLFALLLAVILIMSIAGCSGSEGTESVNDFENGSADSEQSIDAGSDDDTGVIWDPYTPYEETVIFTKGAIKPTGNDNYPEGDSLLNNDYTRYVKEQVNVQPKLAWEVDANNYDQKVSLSIAAKDIPDIMIVDRKIYKQLVENGLIQDMTKAYEKCISPFLREQYDSYGSRLFDEIKVDGKMMGIPGTQIFGQNFATFWIRKDWLDKVEMEPPETMEEIKAVAKAFIEKDPGGNGSGKTIGLTCNEEVYKGNYALNTLFYSHNAFPGLWIEKDGEVVYGSTLPEMKEALSEIREMYAEGILDKEFAIRKDTDRESLVASGKTGMLFGFWWPYGSIGDSVINDPEADWMPVVTPLNENGNLMIPEFDPVNGILVVRKGYEHPEAIVKCLNACYDILRGNGQKGSAAYDELNETSPNMNWGVMPIALQIDHRDAIAILTEDLKHALEVGDKNVMEVRGQMANYDIIVQERENPKADPGIYNTALARTVGSEACTSDKIVEQPVAFFGRTESMSTKWANLEKTETEMMMQIIMDEKSIGEFDKFVEQWYRMGGQQITNEVNAEIKK